MLRFFKRRIPPQEPFSALVLLPGDMPEHHYARAIVKGLSERALAFDIANPLKLTKEELEQYSVLFLTGGLAIRDYMTNEQAESPICPQIQAIVAAFYAKNRTIAAPCMALPVVVEALRGRIKPEAYHRYHLDPASGCVWWKKERIASTHRPMIGLSGELLAERMNQFIGGFTREFFA